MHSTAVPVSFIPIPDAFPTVFISPLQQCSPTNADVLEQRWIAKLGAQLNTRHPSIRALVLVTSRGPFH